MIIPFTILFGVVGYLYYKSKDEVSLVESDQIIEDDLYKDIEDLFI